MLCFIALSNLVRKKNKTTAMKYFYFYISLLYFNFEAIFIRNKLL